MTSEKFTDVEQLLRAANLVQEQQSWPPGGPNYSSVDDASKMSSPYEYVFKLSIRIRNDLIVDVGTAWQLNGGVLVTAAHVTTSTHALILHRHDGTTVPVSAHTHPQYQMQKSNIFDLAIVTGHLVGSGGLTLVLDAQSTSIVALGFPRIVGELVEHFGDSVRRGDWLIHTAHTDPGHSGGPILHDGNVHGIHLGPAATVNDWAPGTFNYNDHPAGANAALVFQQAHLNFLSEAGASL